IKRMRLPVGPTAKRGAPRKEMPMTNHRRLTRILVSCFSFCFVATSDGKVSAQGQPEGQLTIAFDASIASSFLDPAETPGIGTPFVFLYALHDALIKPLPGNDMAPCLDRKSTRLNSSHVSISYAVFCLKKKTKRY